MTCTETIRSSIAKVRSKKFQENAWGARHADAFDSPRGMERPIVGLYRALAEYADTHLARYASPIGDDGVLGDEWMQMLKALGGLLNGELGRLDGGTLDALRYALAETAGFTREELET